MTPAALTPANIKEFRALMDAALREERLGFRQLLPKRPKVWCMPETDIIRYFHMAAMRRPWGFRLSGGIGIEIPALRKWLRTHKPGEGAGRFNLNFVGYHIANDSILGDFDVVLGDPVPADLWAGLIRDRLETIPETLSDLVDTYRSNREALGWLAHPSERDAWSFLMSWLEQPDPSLQVPRWPWARSPSD